MEHAHTLVFGGIVATATSLKVFTLGCRRRILIYGG